MNIITQNPFRVLGLTGNATEKELQKQIGIIKRYAEVGKSKTFDYDFEFIGDFTRSAEEIQEASNRIEQAHKKFLYSLFWFVKNNQFDEIAFNNLKEKEIEKAIEIWNKTLKEEITTKNYSSYLNLSTLYIALSTIEEQIDLQKLQTGISLKGNLIYSESLKDLSKLITGNGVANDPIDISKKFVDEVIELLKPYLNRNNGISTNDLISLFNTFPSNIQKYISSKFTEVPISAIENKIEKTTRKRKDNPQNAVKYAEELYKSSKHDITLLKNLMGSSNVQFRMLSDKVANEILQCGIDYFKEYEDCEEKHLSSGIPVEHSQYVGNSGSSDDLGTSVMKLFKTAKSMAVSTQTKERIIKNIEGLQEWVVDKPNRERQKVIAEDLAFVTAKLQRFQNLQDTVGNAKDLVDSCKPRLVNIKNALGSHDDFYLKISSAVVSNAQGMLITAVNEAQEGFKKYQEFGGVDLSMLRHSLDDSTKRLLGNLKIVSLEELSRIINSAYDVTSSMQSIDMGSNLKQSFQKNRETLGSIRSQINSATSQTTSGSSSGGCYIATMAYGDYDHPQVKILRKFRDETLATSLLGRSFISFYYATSPRLVKLLNNQEYITKLIRNLLDRFINKLK